MRNKIIELLDSVRKEEDKYSELAFVYMGKNDIKNYIINLTQSTSYLKFRCALEDILNEEE